ncbi:hypothetical protein [Nocardioides ochotonae]|uniref:hypothetical protein n=1 Tax=Nocardioides ochotonae TaxID=2685869 RepID=UPI00140D5A8A|nr:hypothetical protein [Nocardioides ochotonae]
MTGDHVRRHRDLEEVDELASVAKAAIVSCVAFLVGIPALLAVWGRFEPDVVALAPWRSSPWSSR